MKRLKICVFLFILTCGCLFCACTQMSSEKLSAPCNLRMEDNVLVWDEVENATGYVVSYEYKEYETKESRYDLSLLAAGNTYEIEVLAEGDGEYFEDSEWTKFICTIEPESSENYEEPEKILLPTENLSYTLLDDGSGYEVSRGTADLAGTIVIPDYYLGLPVKKVGVFSVQTNSGGVLGFEPNTKTTGIRFPTLLEEIGALAFTAYTELTEIEIPENVKMIGSNSFGGCSKLEKVILHPGLREIRSSAFRDCSSLAEIDFPDTVQSIHGSILDGTAWMEKQPEGFVINSGALLTYKGEPNEVIEIPSEIKFIADDAFFLSNIVSVTIPDGILLNQGVFNGCKYLKTVELPRDLKNIPAYAFSSCIQLETITIPEGVIEIGECAFRGTALKKIELPSTLQKIDSSAFESCNDLTSIEIPESVTEIFYPFRRCKNLKEIVLPSGLASKASEIFEKYIEKIYYRGTATEWKENVSENFVLPENATVYFYVQNKEDVPADGGAYWHYEDDVPVIW